MGDDAYKRGSVKEFNLNWKDREERLYNHWAAAAPKNQIQFAFKNHWEVFQEILGLLTGGHFLEVGCGRGTLSSFFADAGFSTTMLDTSMEVLKVAQNIFHHNGHRADYVQGDANNLPFKDERFDVIGSIGLLEHFEDVGPLLAEQWRILKPGGWLLNYIVPERPDNCQRWFNWVNALLKLFAAAWSKKSGAVVAKEPIYRNDFDSSVYVKALEPMSIKQIFVSGMYPVPMVSHSPEFPFTLLPSTLERILVSIFGAVVRIRGTFTGRNGWLCDEGWGQAFLVAVQK
ncbi:MAG: class I SAM-dependent methyltransferase [Proteobacteria bacterium]|nr:class I SAM-dependent methyltransferase [Pseudomonadota bacterium]MBU4384641.1 class I SAM-dependent methyltransferase [Pseudomonadota bacterium]MCG2766211.1 class I SAM-dependent methyltransferase [Desulfarculaceae bacterium]